MCIPDSVSKGSRKWQPESAHSRVCQFLHVPAAMLACHADKTYVERCEEFCEITENEATLVGFDDVTSILTKRMVFTAPNSIIFCNFGTTHLGQSAQQDV